jgi:hypothetical protein
MDSMLAKLEVTSDRAFRGSTPDGPIWVIVGRHALCILAGRPLAVGCEPAAKARTDGVTLGIVYHPGEVGTDSRRRFILYGIVPDSHASVQVRIGSRVRKIPVAGNAYSVKSRVPVLKVP